MFLNAEDPLYKLFLTVRALNEILDDRESCFYCGDIATCEDHVLPHSFLHSEEVGRRGYEKDTLPACKECNCVLSDRIYESLTERLDDLNFRIGKRLKTALATGDWTEDQLKELSGRLREEIRVRVKRKKVAEARMNNLSRTVAEAPAIALFKPKEGAGRPDDQKG